MTGVVHTQLAGLARTLAELKDRVRVAVAGELGRAVSGAVQQVVQALAAGPNTCRWPSSSYRVDDRDDRWYQSHDPWADDEPEPDAAAPAPDAGVPAAVAAGVFAARWWLGRRGTLVTAAGVGVGVGLFGVFGGPAARTAVAALAAVADVLGATDALGAAAARLDRP